MQTKEFTVDQYEKQLARMPAHRRAIVERHGIPLEIDGVRWHAPGTLPLATRAIESAALVTRIAPTTTSPIVAPTSNATPSAPAKATPTHDTSDLMHELNRAAMSPEERDVVDRLDRCFAALPKSTPATPRTKASNLDTTDLLAELTQGLDLAEHREPEVRREGDTSDLLAELLGGDA